MPFDPTPAELEIAELYEITLRSGAVARFTSRERDVEHGGQTFQAIPIRRSEVRFHADLQVDKVTVEMGIIGVKIGEAQYSIPTVIKRDYLRNAHVKILLLDRKNDAACQLFEGWATGEIGYNKGILSLQVGSILDKLQDKFPKLIYSETCNHVHYGPYCGLNEADWRESGTTAEGTTVWKIYSDLFLFSYRPQGWWSRGKLVLGDCERTVLAHEDGHVILMTPLWETPEVGASFTCAAGCDRTGPTCAEKFDNYENFFGFEYVPKPETLYGGF